VIKVATTCVCDTCGAEGPGEARCEKPVPSMLDFIGTGGQQWQHFIPATWAVVSSSLGFDQSLACADCKDAAQAKVTAAENERHASYKEKR